MLLNFDMTTEINRIVNVGAGGRMNDTQFLERELGKWLRSRDRKMMIDAEKYYKYAQAINNKRRLVIGEGGEMREDPHLPNNRYIDNVFGLMVDQKVNYLLSQPLTFKSDNQDHAHALNVVFNKRVHRTLKNLGRDSYLGGIGWLYPHYDENGQFKIRRFKPYEILPFWKDDDHEELEFAVRYYTMNGYEGQSEKVFQFVEVYDTNGIHKFTFDNGYLLPDYTQWYFKTENVAYNWNRVPLIPFKANSNELPMLTKCKSLQDAINEILSNFGDGMQENASGNSILIIKNYDGENLGTFRKNISQYKAVKVKTVDGANGGIDSLQIEVNCANYQCILSELKKALIQNCRGYDVDELKSSGSPNEMSIKSIYSQIDLDANEIETEYQASFEDLLWFVHQHLAMTGVGDFENDPVDVIFNRDMMVNESQVIQDVIASAAVLSRKTCISQHPFVTDVEGELEQIKQEQQEAMEDVYQNALMQKSIADDDSMDDDPVEDEE